VFCYAKIFKHLKTLKIVNEKCELGLTWIILEFRFFNKNNIMCKEYIYCAKCTYIVQLLSLRREKSNFLDKIMLKEYKIKKTLLILTLFCFSSYDELNEKLRSYCASIKFR